MNNELIDKITGLFRNDEEIAAVYLFGSQAKDKGHGKSDIDLGFLFNEQL